MKNGYSMILFFSPGDELVLKDVIVAGGLLVKKVLFSYLGVG